MERKYYDLTSAQMILFFSQKYTIHKQVNNICTSVLTDMELDFDILKKAIEKAYERNDSFRVRIVEVDKVMKQYFGEYEKPSIQCLDFRGRTQDEMENTLYRIARKPVTVFGTQMSRIYMMHSFDGKCGLYFVVSHLILDSWAITTFFKDILAIYEALLNGTEMPKPLYSYEKLLNTELNYRNTEAYKKDRAFLENEFNGKEEPIFTHINGYSILEKYRVKMKNPDLRSCNGDISNILFTKAKNVMLPVPGELAARMESYSTANNVSLQSVVLAALRTYLSKVNKNEKDIGFHTVVARRGTLQEKYTGGTRVHFMPFRTIIDENKTFKEACEIINDKQSSIYRHAEIDPLEVMGMWKKAYNTKGSYFGLSVTFQPVKLTSPGGMRIETKWYGNGTASQNAYLTVMDGDGTGSLKFYYEYQTHAVSFDTIEKMHSYMMKVMEAGTANTNVTIGELLGIE